MAQRSNFVMRMRWRPILCFWGLILFALLTYGSMQANGHIHPQYRNRYFWWGSVRLDSDPLNQRPKLKPCVEESDENCAFEPQFIWVSPGWIEKALILTALPALALSIAVVRGLAHFGISELLSFLVATPLLILAWFYAVGWCLDRWRYKRSLHRVSVGQS